MQAAGFFMLSVLFGLQGALYDVLLGRALGAFQFLYYFSAFWQNLGPNCTTWLVASEVRPAQGERLSTACDRAVMPRRSCRSCTATCTCACIKGGRRLLCLRS